MAENDNFLTGGLHIPHNVFISFPHLLSYSSNFENHENDFQQILSNLEKDSKITYNFLVTFPLFQVPITQTTIYNEINHCSLVRS